jgi:hypothetical protein
MRCVPFAAEWQLDLEEIRGERSPDLARDHPRVAGPGIVGDQDHR